MTRIIPITYNNICKQTAIQQTGNRKAILAVTHNVTLPYGRVQQLFIH